jgi:hypothetical protein
MDGWDGLSDKRGVYVDGALSASKRARGYCRQLPQTVRNGKLFVGWMATGLSADRGTGKLMIVQHAGVGTVPSPHGWLPRVAFTAAPNLGACLRTVPVKMIQPKLYVCNFAFADHEYLR